MHARGDISYEEFMDMVAASAPSIGHCNTMGTASSMNSIAEALGMSLTGCAAVPAPYEERSQMSYDTGIRIVKLVEEDLKPSDILTKKSFENAIVTASAIGASSNAPPHLIAIAKKLNSCFFVIVAVTTKTKIGMVNSGSTTDILFQVTRSSEKGQKIRVP